jgi:hypothetical protein
MSYKGRPYAGVGTSVRMRGGQQSGPCKYRVVRCGQCDWCAAKKASSRIEVQLTPRLERNVSRFMWWSFAALGVFLLVMGAIVGIGLAVR